MAPRDASPAVSVERFFHFSLLGLVTSGYLAVAGSGYLDTPTVAVTGFALAKFPGSAWLARTVALRMA